MVNGSSVNKRLPATSGCRQQIGATTADGNYPQKCSGLLAPALAGLIFAGRGPVMG